MSRFASQLFAPLIVGTATCSGYKIDFSAQCAADHDAACVDAGDDAAASPASGVASASGAEPISEAGTGGSTAGAPVGAAGNMMQSAAAGSGGSGSQAQRACGNGVIEMGETCDPPS